MNDLRITEAKAEKLDEVEDLALSTIKEALGGTIESDNENVKVAVKMMGVVAKNRQTLTNRSAIEFSMANAVLADGQLEKYVRATSPQIQKALGRANA